MSSMRNAVQRRNHKERAQPLERSKWGLLEKHKDYSLRARDHNDKKRRIKALKQKVAEHNPDEFAFGMMSSRTEGGLRVKDRGKENGTDGPMSMDVAKLLKTQDAGYLRTVQQQIRRQRERTRDELALAGVRIDPVSKASASNRIVFDDDDNLIEDYQHDQAASDLDAPQPEPSIDKEVVQRRRKQRKTKEALMSRLSALSEKDLSLTKALEVLETQRAKMSRTIGGINKNGVKFKIRERKR